MLFYLLILLFLSICGLIQTKPWEYCSTIFFLRDYFPQYDGHVIGRYTAQFWSLAVEEHFYSIWPALVLLLGRKLRRLGWTAFALAVLIFAWRRIDAVHGWLIPYGTSVFAKSDTRMDGLLWGCLAAIAYPMVLRWFACVRRVGKFWIPICLAIAFVASFREFFGQTALEGVLFPALLISTAIAPYSVLSRFLELPLLQWIGRISYSLYIWQQLLIFPSISSHSPMRLVQQFPVNLLLIFLAASLSYYFVEQPITSWGRRLSKELKTAPPKPEGTRALSGMFAENVPLPAASD